MALLAAPEKYPSGGTLSTVENFNTHIASPGLPTHLDDYLSGEEVLDVVVDDKQEGIETYQKSAPVSPIGATESPSPLAPQGIVACPRRSGGDVRSLLHFMSVAGGDIRAALDKSAPCKRSVDHRKYLQKQLSRLTTVLGTNANSPPADPTFLVSSVALSNNQLPTRTNLNYCITDTAGNTACNSPQAGPFSPCTKHQTDPSSSSPPTALPHPTLEQQQQREGPMVGGKVQDAAHSQHSEPAAAQSAGEQLGERRCGEQALWQCGRETPDSSDSRDNPGLVDIESHRHSQKQFLFTSPQTFSPEQQRLSFSRSISPPTSDCSEHAGDERNVTLLKLQVLGATQHSLKKIGDESTAGLPSDELLILDVTGTEESCSVNVDKRHPRQSPAKVRPTLQEFGTRSDSSSGSTAGQCMASPPAGESSPLPPPHASVTGSSSRPSSPASFLSLPSTDSSRPPPAPPAVAMVVASSSGPHTLPGEKVQRDGSDRSACVTKSPKREVGDKDGESFSLPPDIADDHDPLFDVPGVIDPTRSRDRKDVNSATSQQKASVPLRQRQLPASFWKEPRPEEKRAARLPLDPVDLLSAQGAFFVPYPSNPGVLPGPNSHTYDSYKAMAELYGARFQGLVGEAAAAHRSLATGGAAPGGTPAGLTHPDYLLSAYSSKLPRVNGVNSSDPTPLSAVTAAAYHTGGLYPWSYGLLSADAEKVLATRLQANSSVSHLHHHSQQHQHHHVQTHHHTPHHPHLSLLNPPSSSVAANPPHPMIHGHTLLYHRHSAAAAAAALTTSHPSTCSTAATTSSTPASSRVVTSPPGRGPIHAPGTSPPQALWDPLAAMTAQSLLRQPPTAAGLWRPIPTKTLSSYPSRFHPFADVH